MGISCEDVRFGWVRFGLVSNAHAQGKMGNGVIIPPHDFKQPSRCYYRLWDVFTMTLEQLPMA
jgi:hypothetical protein